ncbi:vesicle coat component [Neophaeococcomyces mojaviensis]|uniref:Vesicle coat component n=1 Tax=Neophaeococcomyces mojaviensis TaxID=3383035 RepID=A0ACC3AEA0_9EURO|nr:vesicle coat component [Knufia sp. JES_112]
MDFANYSHDGEHSSLTEQKESHGQYTIPADRDADTGAVAQQSGVPDLDPIHHSPQQASHTFADGEPDEADEADDRHRVDPAWGIKRIDSAHILDAVRRTSSFPTPPPDLPTAFTTHGTSEQPQAESAIEVPAQEAHIDEQEPLTSAHEMSEPSQQDAERDHEFPTTHEEMRYEEGVPLISAPTEISPVTQDASTIVSAFESISTDEASDFFTKVEDASQLAVNPVPVLERKGTTDVLNGLGLPRDVPDSPPLSAVASGLVPAAEKPKETDLAAAFAETLGDEDDPWKAAMGEDDEFLVEDADDLLPDSDEDAEPSTLPTSVQPPQSHLNQPLQRHNSNVYAPHQPTTAELTQFGATTHNSIGLSRQMAPASSAFQPRPQPPNINNRAESFVDQSKGGYKSPYDLPMDLAPKVKAHAHRTLPSVASVPPPPRTSSMNAEKVLQSPFTPTAPVFNQSATSSPLPLPAAAPIDRSGSVPVKPAPTSNKRASGFFEELPITVRARPSPAPARAPAQTPQGPTRQPVVPSAPLVASPPQVQHQLPPQQQQDPYAPYQLHAPEKLDPYASSALLPTQPPSVPAVSSRYSPAPPSIQNGIRPSPSPRYSPAPPLQPSTSHNRYVSQPVSAVANLPFQPRTSSPLARQRRSVDEAAENAQAPRPSLQHSASASLPHASSFQPATAQTLSPPRTIEPVKQPEIVPPRRSQTQSPSRQIPRPGILPRIAPPLNRPASAFGQLSPVRIAPPTSLLSPPRLVPQARIVEEVDYIIPTDEAQNDPLERWKGTPIFRFGFGGTVVTTFPRRTPRFSSAATRPQIKASPGEVNIRKLENIVGLQDSTAKFPGPLRGKSKKKDVMTWLSMCITALEATAMTQPSKQLEEKILLWKIVKVLVEQDGSLENPQAVQAVSEILMPEVHGQEESTSPQYLTGDNLTGIYRPAAAVARTETVDPAALETLRRMLLKGKRDDAVWQAVDSRLWAHALLLSSTLDRKVWKQVVQEFVKQEVKTIGSNAESLCALYEILGGNLEESVDQLVPPSARAGLQMVSKVEPSGPTRNALEGLDRWKETLCLVLNNRSVEDQKALMTLARLLSDYGRVEASQICYLFARTALPTLFSGLDDPNASIVLLGADHRNQPLNFSRDTDSILLTEVYEFAMSTLAPGTSGVQMPHLAVYKLQRANELMETGMKVEAQAYCDAIAAGLKSNTKHSLYYHPLLLGEVEDLSNRLKQVPIQSQSWMTKPSIEKVSGSLFNKFSQFVTGDDSDAESKGSARDAAEAAPFANVSGSPTLSRNASQTDLYGSYPTMTPAVAQTTAGSRYAPNGISSTRSSSELTRGRPSFESQRSPPSTSHSNEPRSLYAPAVQPHNQYSPLGMSPPVHAYQPIAEPLMPHVAEEPTPAYPAATYVPKKPSYAPEMSSYNPEASSTETNGLANHTQPAFGGYTPVDESSHHKSTEPPSNNPPTSTFEPFQATYSGYQPPEETGYVPYQPEPDSDAEDSKPKPKKSFMDDDDDDFPRMSNPKITNSASTAPPTSSNPEAVQRKANDEAADAAFRAAAEEDERRAKEAASNKKGSGSWLGGWFSGSKKPESLDAGSGQRSTSAGPKVHRVHLGESKMKLYYDKEKGKWINPDNPAASEKKVVAPPPRSGAGTPGNAGGGPPRGVGAPPRSVSTPQNITSPALGGPPSRTGTPASNAADAGSEGTGSRPGSSDAGPGSGMGIASMLPPSTTQSLGLGLPTPPGSSGGPPPSRPASALSNAGGLDDLLGPASGPRKVSGRTAKGKKGRYIDVMAK